jgi:hypothetical protein
LNYTAEEVILVIMAAKKVIKKETKQEDFVGGQLDPKEEKVLDWILNGVVVFVLGWLALGVLLSVGGLFGLWK